MQLRHLEQLYSPFIDASNITDVVYPKHLALRAVVGVVCSLSMGGALLIILSYVLIKSIRTKTREILVHLSVADFGVACSNFIGVAVYFDPYIRECNNHHGNNSTLSLAVSCSNLKNLCVAQAVFAAFSTLVSVLWTLCLSAYIYTLIVHHKRGLHTRVVHFSYFFCWGVPLLVSVWLVCTDRLGYSPYGGSGWCSLKLEDTPRSEIFIVIFANDLWIFLTFVMVTILYFTTHCYLRFQLPEANPLLLASSSRSTVHTVDTKFLLIPAAFLLLRIWSIVLTFTFVYLRLHPGKTFTYVLLFATGIGDSGQGFINALLFCLFTPKVREKLCCCCRSNRCCHSRQYVSFRQSLLRSKLADRTVSS